MKTRMGADADLIIVYRKDIRDGEQLIELVGEKAVGFPVTELLQKA